MKTWIGLLRAVNLAGHNAVAMSELRAALTQAGFQDVQTVLQSGNVIFRSDAGNSSELERDLEQLLFEQLGVKTDFFVRSPADWKKLVAQNPFPIAAVQDPGRLVVMFLRDAPAKLAVTALRDAIKGREMVQVKGCHAYFVYPDGFGRTKLTNAVIEKHLGTRATGRNWNTVLRLARIAT